MTINGRLYEEEVEPRLLLSHFLRETIGLTGTHVGCVIGECGGQRVTDAYVREMAETAATEVDPMDDNRGSAEYKRELVKVLVRRATQEALLRMTE